MISGRELRVVSENLNYKYYLNPLYHMGLRERFLKIYSNIPLGLRKEIILVIDGEPITWNVAYIEVKNDTEKGKKILKKLKELEII